jgi:hypothetical protein
MDDITSMLSFVFSHGEYKLPCVSINPCSMML